ncbi:helix-turn-helix domain-containing protein [Facklamia sp. P9177]|uniref:helix-turn-helix domain-containing protein n=1 Tax=Facklamia sp. P9177 TaxID=3421945 RepID=UPI003D17D83E
MNEIDKLRKIMNSDMTDSELANIAGMSQQAINKYRKGQSKLENMRFESALKLTKYQEELEMENKFNEIVEYLENYKKTSSNEMDPIFKLFKSDVYTMSKEYNSGEGFLYSKEDWIDWLEESENEEELKVATSKDYEIVYNNVDGMVLYL